MNETIEKFGFPLTLVAEYEHWVVLVRRAQVTAGSLVLAHKGGATSLGAVPAEDFAELARVTSEIEAALQAAFSYDKINYLLLMMVDPHVHYHVVPRYAAPREVGGVTLRDESWPGPPDVGRATELADDQVEAVRDLLRGYWPAPVS